MNLLLISLAASFAFLPAASAQDRNAEAAQLRSCREMVDDLPRWLKEVPNLRERYYLEKSLIGILAAKPNIYGGGAAGKLRDEQFQTYLGYLQQLNEKTVGEMQSQHQDPKIQSFFVGKSERDPGLSPAENKKYIQQLDSFLRNANEYNQISSPALHAIHDTFEIPYLTSPEFFAKANERAISGKLDMNQALDAARSLAHFAKNSTEEQRQALSPPMDQIAENLAHAIMNAPWTDGKGFHADYNRYNSDFEADPLDYDNGNIAGLVEILNGHPADAQTAKDLRKWSVKRTVADQGNPDNLDPEIVGRGGGFSDDNYAQAEALLNSLAGGKNGTLDGQKEAQLSFLIDQLDKPWKREDIVRREVEELVDENRLDEADQLRQLLTTPRLRVNALLEMSHQALASKDVDASAMYNQEAEAELTRPMNEIMSERTISWVRVISTYQDGKATQTAWNSLYGAISDLDRWSQIPPDDLEKKDGVADSKYAAEVERQVETDLQQLSGGMRTLFETLEKRDINGTPRFDIATAFSWVDKFRNPALRLGAKASVCTLAVETPREKILVGSTPEENPVVSAGPGGE